VFWSLKDDATLKAANISALELARETEALGARFPNAAVNPDEQRRLRASLYRPLLALGNDERARLVDLIVSTLFS
jgi:type I restriction enzyme, R subunit